MKESSEEKIKQILKSKINIPSGYVDAINTAFIKKGKSNHFIKILTTTCAGIILTSGIVLAGYNIYQKIWKEPEMVKNSDIEKSLENKEISKEEPLSNLKPTKIIENATSAPNNDVYTVAGVTEHPDYPGGMKKFYQFVANNFQIPIDLKGNGKIYIKFIVEIDGSITNEEILKDVGFGTGEEAIRVIKLSPKWIPAKKDGVPVRVQYSLPITLQQG